MTLQDHLGKLIYQARQAGGYDLRIDMCKEWLSRLGTECEMYIPTNTALGFTGMRFQDIPVHRMECQFCAGFNCLKIRFKWKSKS